MTETEFARLLNRHGASLPRWPAGQQRAAAALLAASPDAQEAWREAAQLDALLTLAVPPSDGPPVELIVARATAVPQGRPAPSRAAWPAWPGFGSWRLGWAPVGALAACLCAGLVLGSTLPHPAPQPGTSDILAIAFGAGRAIDAPSEEP